MPNTLPILGRWKILDNLRRSLVAPTLLMLLVAGWTALPGPRWFWTATVMGVAASQLLPVVARLLVGPGRAQSIPVFLRNLRRDAADRKSTRLNSSHSQISYAVFCLKKKTKKEIM